MMKPCSEQVEDVLDHVITTLVLEKFQCDLNNGNLKSIDQGIRVDINEHEYLNLFVVCNDGVEESLTWLLCLKEIFSKQLPKMPKEYVIRLCFDTTHVNLVALKVSRQTGKCIVVGGVCFRPFLSQRFIEIAFLAVSANHQVSGIGTILMNHLKNYVQSIDTNDADWKQYLKAFKITNNSKVVNSKSKFFTGPRGKPPRFSYISHFLTYADNFAIGFFQKQGFTREVTIESYRYDGYIKDYEGGTLMECEINPYINYLHVEDIVKEQQKFISERLQSFEGKNHVYPGLSQESTFENALQIPGVIFLTLLLYR